uniref:Uncharacterized protein n=1 Tax=Timema douglasi TaxID=61478 RepID=A0A7R8VDH1_TIMDO|nr:unnamed protein product [Timema douglasi]
MVAVNKSTFDSEGAVFEEEVEKGSAPPERKKLAKGKIPHRARKIQNNYSTSPNCNMQLVTMLSTFIVVLRSVTTKLYLEKYRSESAFEISSHNACKHFVANVQRLESKAVQACVYNRLHRS